MLIVSGEARSGTSMMMLVIKKLGINIVGDKFLKKGPDYNPSGIWEIAGIPNNPLTKEVLKKHDIEDAECLKMMSHGFLQSDITLCTKLIWCIREPREVIVSQRNQFNYQGDDHNWGWYNIHMATLLEKKKRAHYWPPTLIVDYADMLFKTASQVKRVARFLGVPYKAKAKKVINRKFYRSKADDIEDNPTARKYYNYLKAFTEWG